MLPKVSVLLTTYNRPLMLEKAVNSVLNQTFKDFELIILDDNSDDPEQLKLLEFNTTPWFGKDILVFNSRIKKEDRKKTTRYATMVNRGLELARGQYISYLCDDDYYEPQRLERMVNFLDTHPEALVVHGNQRIVELKDGVEIPYAGQIRKSLPLQTDASCQVDHSSVMMRKSLVNLVGYWDDDPGWWGSADAVYWKKINTAGIPFYGIDEILDTHVYHEGSWTKEGKWTTL